MAEVVSVIVAFIVGFVFIVLWSSRGTTAGKTGH